MRSADAENKGSSLNRFGFVGRMLSRLFSPLSSIISRLLKRLLSPQRQQAAAAPAAQVLPPVSVAAPLEAASANVAVRGAAVVVSKRPLPRSQKPLEAGRTPASAGAALPEVSSITPVIIASSSAVVPGPMSTTVNSVASAVRANITRTSGTGPIRRKGPKPKEAEQNVAQPKPQVAAGLQAQAASPAIAVTAAPAPAAQVTAVPPSVETAAAQAVSPVHHRDPEPLVAASIAAGLGGSPTAPVAPLPSPVPPSLTARRLGVVGTLRAMATNNPVTRAARGAKDRLNRASAGITQTVGRVRAGVGQAGEQAKTVAGQVGTGLAQTVQVVQGVANMNARAVLYQNMISGHLTADQYIAGGGLGYGPYQQYLADQELFKSLGSGAHGLYAGLKGTAHAAQYLGSAAARAAGSVAGAARTAASGASHLAGAARATVGGASHFVAAGANALRDRAPHFPDINISAVMMAGAHGAGAAVSAVRAAAPHFDAGRGLQLAGSAVSTVYNATKDIHIEPGAIGRGFAMLSDGARAAAPVGKAVVDVIGSLLKR